jgi:hypothetical protein
MVKSNAASNKRKAGTSTDTAKASPSPSTRSSTKRSAKTTPALLPSSTGTGSKKRKVAVAKDKVMLGKGRKNRQVNDKATNIREMFQSIVEDPNDTSAVVNLEGNAGLHGRIG